MPQAASLPNGFIATNTVEKPAPPPATNGATPPIAISTAAKPARRARTAEATPPIVTNTAARPAVQAGANRAVTNHSKR